MTGRTRSLLGSVVATSRMAPDRAAVVEGNATLSYGDLLLRSAAIARELRRCGVTRGDRVGLLLAPGADAVAAAIGTHMLGAAYVPIAPETPPSRTAAMLANCGATACVVGAPGQVAATPEVPTEGISTSLREPPTSDVALGMEHSCTDVAYVIHTSGSSGTPKGIEVEHRSVVNLLTDLDRLAPVPAAYRGSWWSRPSFDVSIWESWAPLVHGGTVVVVPDEHRLEGPRLACFLDSAHVQSGYVPAAYLPDLFEYLHENDDACRGLYRLLVGVEPIPRGLLQDILALRPGLSIVNGYGPAETTICCTLYLVPRTGGRRGERTPIGKVVAGNHAHIISDDGTPSATGTGELVIAGIGVARGYLGASVADAARFISDPSGGPERAYRTGDLVRRLPDGNLVFDGRRDRQLKVRGYRVEPGEVENALRSAADLRDVVVGQRDRSNGEPVLVAYVVPRTAGNLDERPLLTMLAGNLPAYAVPATLIQLGSIPMTANGKVDHAALAAVPMPATCGDAPCLDHTDQEETPLQAVIRVWGTVLNRDDIRPEDCFVALGGTSLGAARAAALLRERTGKGVAAHEVLSIPRACDLAAALEQAVAWPGETATKRTARTSGPLSPTQVGLWVHDQMSGDGGLYVESVCYTMSGELDTGRLTAAVYRAAAAHPAFGAIVTVRKGKPQLDLVGKRPSFALCDAANDIDLDRILMDEVRRPFDLATGPLMRALLIRRSRTEHVLLLGWHHLLVDGASVRLFLADLAGCYRSPGHQPASGTLTICDLNERQAAYSVSEQGRTDLDAVTNRLQGYPAIVIPRKSTAADPDRCRSFPVTLPGALVREAELASSRSGLTIASVVCAAYQRALATTFGMGRFLLGCAVDGRSQPGTEKVAGYLVNTVLLRAGQAEGASAEAFARTVSAELDVALQYQAVPFPHLARRLSYGGGSHRAGLPQFYFSFDAAPELELTAVRCLHRQLHPARAKFDVTLSVLHSPGRIGGVLEHRRSVLPAAEVVINALMAGLSDFTAAVLGGGSGEPERSGRDMVHS